MSAPGYVWATLIDLTVKQTAADMAQAHPEIKRPAVQRGRGERRDIFPPW